VTLLYNNMPLHNHLINVNNAAGNSADPSNKILAETANDARPPVLTQTYTSNAFTSTLAPTAVSNAGGNVPHTNLQPFLTVNFIIALAGIFPSRS
jgi:microcystin-dependent protein